MSLWSELIRLANYIIEYLDRKRESNKHKSRQARDDESYRDPGNSFDSHFGLRTEGQESTDDKARAGNDSASK